MTKIKFEPWVGESYRTSSMRLMIIGESHYGKAHEAEVGLTRRVIDDWQSGKNNHRYFAKLAGLLLASATGKQDHVSAFSHIAFYNYIQVLLAENNAERPDPGAWAGAQEPFLEVVRALDPTHILVTSIGVYEHMPEPVVSYDHVLGGEKRLVCEYPTASGRALAAAIPHLSRAAVAKWVPIVAAFRQLPAASLGETR